MPAKKKVKLSEIEVKRLQEKYLTPAEKKGNERSHVGNLTYGVYKLQRGQKIGDETFAYARRALDVQEEPIDEAEVEREVRQEMQLPDATRHALVEMVRPRPDDENSAKHARMEGELRQE